MSWVVGAVLVLLIVVFEAYALFSIKRYSNDKQPKDLIICCLIYGLAVPFFLYYLLAQKGVGTVNFIWNVFSTIVGFFIGVLLFQEHVESLQWLGVFLGVISFGLILKGLIFAKVRATQPGFRVSRNFAVAALIANSCAASVPNSSRTDCGFDSSQIKDTPFCHAFRS